MKNDRTRTEGAVRAGSLRGGRRYEPEVMAETTLAPAVIPANDSDADGDVPRPTEAAAATGTVAAKAERTLSQTTEEKSGSRDMISCTISDGTGRIATMPVAVAVSGGAGMRHFGTWSALTPQGPPVIELTQMVASPFDKYKSDTLKVQFKGLPSGSVISHPQAIAKKNAELAALSDRIAALQIEIAATERIRAEKECDRQTLIDSGGPQEDIDTLSAELARLEDLAKRKAAQKSVAEIDRDIARLESQQLTQRAGASGTASFHGPRSGYVLQLPDSHLDGCNP